MIVHRYALAAGLVWVAWMHFEYASSQTHDVLRGLDSLRRGIEPDPTLKRPGESSTLQVQTPKPSPLRKLKPGMTETEVMGVLGVPDRIESQSQTFRWYWDRGETKGWVSFGSDSRKVIEWRNP